MRRTQPCLLLLLWLTLPAAAQLAGAQDIQETTRPRERASPTLVEDDWLFSDDYGESYDSDPLEPGNRLIFGANELLYTWLLDPLSSGYRFVVPDPAREAVRNLFENLSSPAILVNDLAQLQGKRAGATSARFLINSTLGLAGLFDPASHFGIEGHHADFGETLGVYGAGQGPYLVIPMIGPSTLRDAVGGMVDWVLRPDLWMLATGPGFVIVTGEGLSTYELESVHLDELRKSSIDFYASLRSAYLMQREAQVEEARRLWEVDSEEVSEQPEEASQAELEMSP